jgi:hypothetical protein
LAFILKIPFAVVLDQQQTLNGKCHIDLVNSSRNLDGPLARPRFDLWVNWAG